MGELGAASGSMPAPRGDTAEQVRATAAAARAQMQRRVADLGAARDAARAELERRRAAMEADFRRQAAELEAQMAPLQEQLRQMAEVLWSVNLYLGRDETLRLLRDGEPAPVETPLTVRQRVLVMAEESLVLMGHTSTGMTSRDLPEFIEWLLSDDSHLDRVLPDSKGVVVLVPTKVESRSGNPWEDAAKNAANQMSYWLLRNGERLYLLTVDPDLSIRDRLLPRRSEFTEVFDQGLFGYGRRAGEPLEPGSEEWLRLEEIADARRRHYMRVIMVLQGIVDRTPVWHPLPDGWINLLSIEAQETGKVRLIQDGEDSIALTDGGETFAAYQRRLNGLLRPGLRVIGDWLSRFGDEDRNDKKGRVSPTHASGLDPDTPYLLEDRRDGGFVFRFKRTDMVYRQNVPVPGKPGYHYRGSYPVEATRRASYFLRPEDPWVLPYDLVTVPELERFLASRDERSKHFLTMVPTIKAALAAKRAEAQAEAPFRVLLRGLLLTAGADELTVDQALDDLVHWWKLKNTWSKPLNGEPTHEGKAAREIVTEFKVRQQAAGDLDLAARMVSAGRRIPRAIAVAQNRRGQWFAYAPSTGDENVFLDITPLHSDGTPGKVKTWSKVQQRTASLLTVAWSGSAWSTWNFAANPRHYLTGPERDGVIEEVRRRAEGILLAVVEFHDPARPAERGFASYAWTNGVPETAEIRPSNDPLSDHDERPDRMITMKPYRVAKDTKGIRLDPGNIHDEWGNAAFSRSFSRFSGGSPWGNTPWWPTNAHRYRDARARLVWSDETALERMNTWRLACLGQRKVEQTRRNAIETEAYRYVRLIETTIMTLLEAKAHERFLEDYGHDADDLWAGHLTSLHLRNPIHPRTLWGLIAQRIERDESPIGATLGELAKEAYERGNRAPGEWHPDPGVQNLHGFDDVVVPGLAT